MSVTFFLFELNEVVMDWYFLTLFNSMAFCQFLTEKSYSHWEIINLKDVWHEHSYLKVWFDENFSTQRYKKKEKITHVKDVKNHYFA